MYKSLYVVKPQICQVRVCISFDLVCIVIHMLFYKLYWFILWNCQLKLQILWNIDQITLKLVAVIQWGNTFHWINKTFCSWLRFMRFQGFTFRRLKQNSPNLLIKSTTTTKTQDHKNTNFLEAKIVKNYVRIKRLVF